jgi:hypothetical protein
MAKVHKWEVMECVERLSKAKEKQFRRRVESPVEVSDPERDLKQTTITQLHLFGSKDLIPL